MFWPKMLKKGGGWQDFDPKTRIKPCDKVEIKNWKFLDIRKNSTPKITYILDFMYFFHILAKKGQKSGEQAWFWPQA